MAVQLTINSNKCKAQPGITLFELAEQMQITVPTSCYKQGKCKECMMEVEDGSELLSLRTDAESHLKDNFRLSCQCRIAVDEGTITCHTLRRASVRIEKEGSGLSASDIAFIPDPAVTRSGNKVLLDGLVIDQSTGPIYGLALDLGTTTVVLRLMNLETAKVEASTSFENPQRFGGSDVMSRIQYDTDNKGRLLQRTLLGYLSHAIESLPVDSTAIYEMVIGGNSTMRDLFFGLNVYPIGQKPYKSITETEMRAGERETTSLAVPARKLRLPIHPQARIYGLPLISGHIGADTAACLLAIQMAEEDRIVALMDIGTNTEIVVGNKNKILAASCPAGPAFEGGGIDCGVPGLDGAIERVKLDDQGNVATTVIGDIDPIGICGSGLIDVLGELRRTGKMNSLGRFHDGTGPFMIDAKHNIYMGERDINELAQAKGANAAGFNIVLKNYGISADDIGIFYLAGGFGRHINLHAAQRIGLIPDLEDSRMKQIGNATIEGLTLALLSVSKRNELEKLIKQIEHIELETDPEFFDHFVDGCQFAAMEVHVTNLAL